MSVQQSNGRAVETIEMAYPWLARHIECVFVGLRCRSVWGRGPHIWEMEWSGARVA